jgi:LuxR family maltose regulon positive regulatory protein
LSQRELEVLRLLMTELSALEIADELVVSVSTVRSHIKNIYGKLDVHSRHEAVVKAGTIGLV